jgi:tetratricopeptide (TPR) repeat protein
MISTIRLAGFGKKFAAANNARLRTSIPDEMPDLELKPLSREAIPAALEKAERYRLLNEPAEAESICLDVLEADPENQQAIITLLLAVTDRFSKGYGVSDTQANRILAGVKGDYERAYYAGILGERRAKAKLAQGTPGASHYAYDELREAMRYFERAEALRPAGNDDALLRWNTCARLIARNKLVAREEDHTEPPLE